MGPWSREVRQTLAGVGWGEEEEELSRQGMEHTKFSALEYLIKLVTQGM